MNLLIANLYSFFFIQNKPNYINNKYIKKLPFGVANKHKRRILFSNTPCSFKTLIAKLTVVPVAEF